MISVQNSVDQSDNILIMLVYADEIEKITPDNLLWSWVWTESARRGLETFAGKDDTRARVM